MGNKRKVYQWERDTDEKGKDESWENGKDGPNTEGVGEGCDPRIGIIVPEIIDVHVPEIGREGKDGGDGHLIHSLI
jgi:hypothetical protein